MKSHLVKKGDFGSWPHRLCAALDLEWTDDKKIWYILFLPRRGIRQNIFLHSHRKKILASITTVHYSHEGRRRGKKNLISSGEDTLEMAKVTQSDFGESWKVGFSLFFPSWNLAWSISHAWLATATGVRASIKDAGEASAVKENLPEWLSLIKKYTRCRRKLFMRLTAAAVEKRENTVDNKAVVVLTALRFWERDFFFTDRLTAKSAGAFSGKIKIHIWVKIFTFIFLIFFKRVYSTYVWFLEKHVSYSLKQLVKSFSFDIPRDRGAGNNAHAAQSMFFACFSTPVMRNDVFFPCSTFSLLYYPLFLLYNVRAKVSLLFLSLQIAFQKGCCWTEKKSGDFNAHEWNYWIRGENLSLSDSKTFFPLCNTVFPVKAIPVITR